MYTEICAELGATIAIAISAPYIQFSLISYPPLQKLGALRFSSMGGTIILYQSVVEQLPESLT